MIGSPRTFFNELIHHHTRAFVHAATSGRVNIESVIGAWHSVTHPVLGESDLIVLTLLESGSKFAVLIENKINAEAQGDQAERYRARGEIGRQSTIWDEFSTTIVAPERYLEKDSEARLYDGMVSYEWVVEYLTTHSTLPHPRMQVRTQALSQAIEQGRRGYKTKHDEKVTAFWRGYWSQLTEQFPDLEMKEPKSVGEGSDWIPIRSVAMPEGFGEVQYRLEAGKVCLATPWRNELADSVREHCEPIFAPDTSLLVTKKGEYLKVCIDVPALDRRKDFESQTEDASIGMRAAYRLAHLALPYSKAVDF